MICKNCSREINDDDMFCGYCGCKVTADEEPVVTETAPLEEPAPVAEEVPQPVYEASAEQEIPQAQPVYETVPPQQNVYQTEAPVANQNYQYQGGYAPVMNNPQMNEQYVQPQPKPGVDKKKLKKIAIIAAAVVVLIIALIVGIKVYSVYKFNQPVELDLNDYIVETCMTDEEIENAYENSSSSDEEYFYVGSPINYNKSYGAALAVHGFNDYAYVDEDELYNVIDWDKLQSDYQDKISSKKDYENVPLTSFIDSDSFKFEIDKNESISNGDKLKVTASADAEEYKYGEDEITLKIKSVEKEFEVKNLKVVKTINPFDCINVYVKGANGNGEAYLAVDDDLNMDVEGFSDLKFTKYDDDCINLMKGDYIVAKIYFYIDYESRYDLSNDDKISVTCECYEEDTLLSDYELYIAIKSKDYNVSGLGDYITKEYKLTDADLEDFKSYTLDYLKESHSDKDSYKNFKFEAAYIMDPKDQTESSSIKNSLFIVYSYDYTFWTEPEKRYYAVRFDDLIANEGELSYSPEYYYYTYSDYNDTIDEAISSDYYSDDYNYKKLS